METAARERDFPLSPLSSSQLSLSIEGSFGRCDRCDLAPGDNDRIVLQEMKPQIETKKSIQDEKVQ